VTFLEIRWRQAIDDRENAQDLAATVKIFQSRRKDMLGRHPRPPPTGTVIAVRPEPDRLV